jgi:hypothetical protein
MSGLKLLINIVNEIFFSKKRANDLYNKNQERKRKLGLIK